MYKVYGMALSFLRKYMVVHMLKSPTALAMHAPMVFPVALEMIGGDISRSMLDILYVSVFIFVADWLLAAPKSAR